MTDGFRNLFYGTAFALMAGWLLYLGRGIILPILAGIIVVYVVIGLAKALARVPLIGPELPGPLRYAISVLAILLGLSVVVALVITNLNAVLARAPQYQEQLLGLAQTVAVMLDFETEPTWETLRREVFAQIDVQSLIGSALASVSAIVSVFVLVMLYAGFLLAERRAFALKLRRLTSNARQEQRVHEVISVINDRIGTYLALKTFLNVVLGLASWIVMVVIGIEFAGFWAVLIALLNYVPYIGSFLGVFFPVALSAVQFGDPGVVLATAVALVIAQAFVGSFLEPYLMGESLNLSPFVILVSVVAWSGIWGIPGALLSVPVMAILVIVFSEFDATRPIAVLLSRRGRVAAASRLEDRPAPEPILPDAAGAAERWLEQ